MAFAALPESAEAQRLKEARRKKKDVEEQRKLGLVPAETDEDGRDINPHIPEYISTVPWYVDSTNTPSLKHQRPHLEKQYNYNTIKDWYIHDLKCNHTTRYRRGACENCGAITHAKKECMERPRKVGAKYTATNIAPDEYTQPQLFLDYDGKRDKWNGYDPEEQKKIIAEYEKIDITRRQLKTRKIQEGVSSDNVPNKVQISPGKEEDEEEDADAKDKDEDKYADEFDMPGQKVDSKMRITVRNLRIREDTAKYLKNLDLNSAYYDPYSRSMRENPYSGKKPNENGYIAENVLRLMGDVSMMTQSQLFAWEAYEHGVDVHLQSDPTKLEMLHKSFVIKDEEFKKGQRESIIEKYGVQDYLEPPSRMLLLGQTEEYTEYSKHGLLIQRHLKATAKSKYEEDVYINNHTTVWGSYWKNGNWGNKCCHSFLKHSYCSGESGRKAQEIMDLMTFQEGFPCVVKQHSTTECSLEALSAEGKQLKKVDELMKLDERKRPYNCMHDGKQSMEAEIETYKIKRQRPEDPMCAFLEKF